MSQIAAALSIREPGSPAIALLIGLGGTVKTQISPKHAYNHDDE
jgi:xanthosine utilization system XapX-like protein